MSAPIEHPSWCDRTECSVTADGESGSHLSRPLAIGTPQEPYVITAQLYQGVSIPGYPRSAVTLVVVDFSLPGYGKGWPAINVGVVLDGERAVQLSRILSSLGREATS